MPGYFFEIGLNINFFFLLKCVDVPGYVEVAGK